MITTMRELKDTDVEHVSGGVCTCHSGENCTTSTSDPVYGGGNLVVFYNCSGLVVGVRIE
jgi:hypothetical protein